MAANYPAGYITPRGRPEDDLYAQPAVNPFAPGAGPVGVGVGYGGYDASVLPAAAVAAPAYAVGTPMVPAAYPMAQAGLVHTVSSGSMMGGYGAPAPSMYGGGYGAGGPGGYYPQQHPPQPPAAARPPRNHAAGPRTQFNKPPPPPVFGANPDIEQGSFSQLNTVTQFTQTAETQMRHAFIRKVYAVLCLQLVASFGLLAYLTFDGAAQAFVLARPGLAYTAMVASFVMLMLLMCYRQSYPANLGLLMIWTLVEAYTISIVTCTYARAGEGEIVLQAIGITALLFFILTVFTLQSKWDFSFLGGICFAGLWILIIWGIVNAIWGFDEGRVYSLIGAIIFSLYIIFDSYLLSTKLPYDEWVLGAISLYLDILNLLLFVLQLLAEAQQREQRRQQQQG